MIRDEQLTELERLADLATVGPWTDPWIDPRNEGVYSGKDCVIGLEDGMLTVLPPDAAFIAAARTAVPALIDDVRELRRQLEQAQAQAAEYRAALEATDEWHDSSYLCTCCRNHKAYGHKPDCKRQNALAKGGE